MGKIIVFNIEARDKIKRGIDTLFKAVSCTLGPKGRNVVIEGLYGSNKITKDGVTVAKEITMDDPIENIGAQMIKEVASKTVDLAGDGTTTSTIIAQSIIEQGFKLLVAGANPQDLKRGIDKATEVVVGSLKLQSVEVGTNIEKIKQVASISANNDTEIGELISEAFSKVGVNGVITVETSNSMNTFVDIAEGMQFNRGYISPYFITNGEKMCVEMENPYILIYDKKISMMKDILSLLEKVVVANRSIVILAEDLDGEALTSLVSNKMQGKLKVAVIKSPGFGDNRKDFLEDIAILTDGTYINSDMNLKLEDTSIIDLGQANSVIIDKEKTIIVGGKGNQEDINNRILQIKAQIANNPEPQLKEKLQERLSKLAGGVAVLHVGAATEIEMKEKKDRVDDALHATRAAVEEGIVPGGGVAYIRALKALDLIEKPSNPDQLLGIDIVKKAIQAPLKIMISNSQEDSENILGKISNGDGDFGYNFRTGVYENLLSSGVIDPTKVSRVALESAASVAGILLTTECVISNDNNIKNNN